VDPASGKEFLYNPTGMTPTLNTSKPVSVTSLKAPATLSDVQAEQANYATIVRDLNDKKQDIQDKKIESKNKKATVAVKQAKLKELEEAYNKLKDTKDKLIVTGNDIQKRLGILTGISKPTKDSVVACVWCGAGGRGDDGGAGWYALRNEEEASTDAVCSQDCQE
jgi:uncharacterized protein YhaN